MATLKEILNLIPDEYKTFEATIARIASDFEDKMGQLTTERINKMVADLASGTRDENTIKSNLLQYVVTPEALKERYGANDDQVERMISGELSVADMAKQAAKAGSGTGGAEAKDKELPGVLTGGETIRVGSRYYQIYEFPPGSGSYISYQYNDKKQLEAAIGTEYDITSRSTSWYEQNVAAEGAAEEVVGLGGTWAGITSEMMREAAQAAGINDPSLVGRIASNKEMQQIMVQALAGDWTPEQVLAAQRQTSFWQNTLYPGISRFYGQTQDPERAYMTYVDNVEGALKALGYREDADGGYLQQVKRMLDAGIDDEIFLSQVPTFIQAKQNAKFAGVLNQWAQNELGRSVEFNDWFDLLSGESQPDLERLAERARLAYQGQEAGAGITDAQVKKLSNRTDLTDAEAAQLFSDFNRSILGLGERGLERGGLTRDEVLSAAAGIDPESGRNVEEVRLAVAKLAREEGLFDDDKIQLYTGFTGRGTPTKPGLASLAPEAA